MNLELGEVIPQCNSCGVCLCWSISDYEYFTYQEFWDEWRCRDCNPDYEGAFKRYKEALELNDI